MGLNPTRFEVYIDRLVFDGVDPGNRAAVEEAIGAALAKELMRSEPVPTAWHPVEVTRMVVAREAAPGLGASVGAAVAGAVRGTQGGSR